VPGKLINKLIGMSFLEFDVRHRTRKGGSLNQIFEERAEFESARDALFRVLLGGRCEGLIRYGSLSQERVDSIASVRWIAAQVDREIQLAPDHR